MLYGTTLPKGGDMVKEFREFIARGNVIDMAVGIILGASFGRVDFSNLFLRLSGPARSAAGHRRPRWEKDLA